MLESRIEEKSKGSLEKSHDFAMEFPVKMEADELTEAYDSEFHSYSFCLVFCIRR